MWGSCFSLGSRRGTSASSSASSSSLTHSLHSLTHSFTHSLTHTDTLTHSITLTHSHTHSLTHSLSLTVTLTLAHSLTHSLPWQVQAQYRELPGCLSRGRHSTQSLLAELRRAWAPLGRGWLRVAGAVLAAFRVAGAVHRASWRSCGARGRRWAAAGFVAGAVLRLPRDRAAPTAGAVHRASWRSCGARGRRWAAAGFAWQAQYTELPGCLSRGRRSTQSLLVELRRAWAPLGRGSLRVAGAVQRASWLPFAWQAQYTERPGGAAVRVGAAGPRLASRGRRSTDSFLAAFRVAGAVLTASWRSCGARGRRWAAAGFAWQAPYRQLPGCLSRGRRSTHSVLAELRRAWAPLGRGWLRVAGAVQRTSWLPFAWQAQYTERPGGAAFLEELQTYIMICISS